MMNKIVLLPLDERPCNINYPTQLALDLPYEVVVPDLSILGDKKEPANIEALHNWILEESKGATHIIVSIDMLVYGGIVPSRLHQEEVDTLLARTKVLEEIKKQYPNITIYAFNLIMRNPTYSSDDEEPSYYNEYGREIHLKGVYEHKRYLNTISSKERTELEKINEVLPNQYYLDYTSRRGKNVSVNKKVIEYLHRGIIDYLIIPQDDASEYGLTKLDQIKVLDYCKELDLKENFLMYPEADAVINTLLARSILDIQQKSLSIYVDYATNEAKDMIPKFEDRALHLSLSSQIKASGSNEVSNIEEADIILMVNAASIMVDINAPLEEKNSIAYTKDRNLDSFLDRMMGYIKDNKLVAVADIAYSNGSDIELIKRMQQENILFKVASYAAWNTSGNTLGTTIPMAIIRELKGETESHLDFLALRYVEDFVYMSMVRKDVSQNVLPELNHNYFDVEKKRGRVSRIVHAKLQKLVNDYLDSDYMIKVEDCYMPWRRMFEVGLTVKAVKKFSVEEHTKNMVAMFQKENESIKGNPTVFIGDSLIEQMDTDTLFEGMRIVNRGISGDHTLGVEKRLQVSLFDITPKSVFLLIGTNDMANGVSDEDIIKGIKKIRNHILNFNKKIKVHVISLLPIYELDHSKIVQYYIDVRSNERIKYINSELKKMKKVTYVDVHSKLTFDGHNININYTTEGLHISEEGYEVMKNVLLKYL